MCVCLCMNTCACRYSFGSAANGDNLSFMQIAPTSTLYIKKFSLAFLESRMWAGGERKMRANNEPLSQNGHIYSGLMVVLLIS